MSRTLLLGLVLSGVVAGCGGDGTHPDAPPHQDTGVDSRCGADTFYTGEYVDWDSNSASFLGIFMASWQVEGDPTRVSHTAPNGRFELCLAHAAGTLVDITPDPTDTTDPYLPGVAVAEQAVISTGVATSTRSFRKSRRDTMFTQIGVPFDATKGQLFVHRTGVATALSIDATHATTQAYGASETWAAGDTGTYVFFPNITLTGGTVTLSGATTISGGGQIPVSPGKLTYVEVIGV